MTNLDPWQQEIVDRLPETAVVTFGADGGQFKAVIGPWTLESPWACHWVEITGPCILPIRSAQISIKGPDKNGRALDVLAALGVPMRKPRAAVKS